MYLYAQQTQDSLQGLQKEILTSRSGRHAHSQITGHQQLTQQAITQNWGHFKLVIAHGRSCSQVSACNSLSGQTKYTVYNITSTTTHQGVKYTLSHRETFNQKTNQLGKRQSESLFDSRYLTLKLFLLSFKEVRLSISMSCYIPLHLLLVVTVRTRSYLLPPSLLACYIIPKKTKQHF